MQIALNDLQVIHIQENHRFEIRVDGLVAELTYAVTGDTIAFLRTSVPPALEGQGVGRKLVMAGLDYARTNGLKIKSLCSFVSDYLQRYPEYQI